MRSITLYLFILFTFFCVIPVVAQQEKRPEIVQEDQNKILLTIVDKSIRVQNAPINSELEVYNIVGVKVSSVRIDSQDKTVEFNLPKGFYILKIENTTRKIVIR